MIASTPTATVLEEAASWPGIDTRPTPRGATAVVLDGHELGHVHSDRSTLDLPLPDDRRGQALADGRANEWFSNWVSKPLRTDADARDGIALLRESYDELRATKH